ncbi:MAG: phosphate acyltransferase PlsX [Bacteroidetes bacterium]|jgi:glycerol-3-phosphate acyltransferase PlsX|nr:phosphate acyltransferase PlsX [Bacteroidota bacterium]HQW46976.1 phosphate acyltransferase PlsX [Chitinophagaceae bacterium]MBK6819912.1 phosphate acyltransferase PlsX [Bacteroidota bacterium]MBK7039880.1 phosphate acyltransferase PlsX [Bacteroidota bacterium]MBK7589153.1 phosphate acyltransferase PlsX [Bacteroidota bacterium]
MRIALDMMGGDYAPEQACLGVLSFLKLHNDCQLFLLGNQPIIENLLGAEASNPLITYIHTEDNIGMDEHPIKAIKEKPNSSIVTGFGLLAKDAVDLFMSSGNTGVMLVGASHMIKVIEGVLRPSIPTPVPQIDGTYSIMLDVGINADCKPENLNQFATLGSIYAQSILGIEKPTVALMNIGEEEGKGNLLAQAAYLLMKENKQIHFIGNIEGRDTVNNKADVIITDGFTGNILLKFAESMYDVIKVKRNIQDEFLDKFNHRLYAGVPVLGINKPVIVGHGVSDQVSFLGMLSMARKMLISKMNDTIKASFAI